MTITMQDLRRLTEKEGLKYLIDPERPALRLGFHVQSGDLEIVLTLQLEGRFLQFRSLRLAECPAGHPHLPAVHRVMAEINYQRRLVKLGWDSRDGEIAAYADLWIMDGGVTQEQFSRMMGNYIPVLDEARARLRATLETGADPGDPAPPGSAPGAAPGAGGPPPAELKALLDTLAERMKKASGEAAGEKPIEEI